MTPIDILLKKLHTSIQSIYTETLSVQIESFLSWFTRLLSIQFNQSMPEVFIPTRGSIYFVELGTNIGTELNKKRPCLIYSDRGYTVGGNVVIIPIKGQYGPINDKFYISFDPTVENGLEKKSLASITDIRSISKKRIQGYIGSLDPIIIETIDHKIGQMLGIHKKTQDL